MAKGSVITTHLINGDPQGIRNVFIKNKTCQMFVIPRELLTDALTNNDINLVQPAIYILIENVASGDGSNPKAYIGHAEDISARLTQHNRSKEDKVNFFQYALVFLSTDHSINKADVQYMEHEAIVQARECCRYVLTNENSGTKPHLTPDQRDVVEEFWDFVKLLTSFYGCKIFVKPLSISSTSSMSKNEIFFLNWKGFVSKAIYGNGEMVILKGSQIRKETVKSRLKDDKKRKKFISENCYEKDGVLYLKHDVPCSSPSEAALLACGTGLNGWVHWKNPEGRTLDEVYR